MKYHPLIRTLVNLRGNARGCVYTEPLWGIPFNLYAPYASVYMLALGLTDSQIGLIASIGLAFQVVWSSLGGAITDKLGRKRTTLIFDLISWSIPALVYAVAQNVAYFVIAALINSLWRVVHTSWQCLLVEDTDPDILVDVFAWTHIAGLLAAFVSPLTGLFIDRFDLVPTIRVLYLLAFVMMTVKALTTNALVTETRQGQVRMQETRDQPLLSVLREYPALVRQILRAPATLLTASLMLVLSVCLMIRNTFWSILVTEKLQIPAEHLAFYPFARSVTMLLFFFLIMPRLRAMDLRRPMLIGFLGLILSQVVLLISPPGGYLLILIATVVEACSVPTANILLEKLVVVTVDARERARIMALLYTAILLFTSPFGWIAGRLSEMNRSLPFILTLTLFAVGGLLTYLTSRMIKGRVAVGETIQETAPA